MKIYQYQQINNLDKDDPMWDYEVCKILKIDTNKPITDVRRDIVKEMDRVGKSKDIKNMMKIGNRLWISEVDFLDASFEQFVELDRLLAEEDNINNLHKLLSIYFRPAVFSIKKLKYVPKKFSLEEQEKLYTILKNEMEIDDAQSLMLFFYQLIIKHMRYINIYYLNEMKKKNSLTKSK